MVTCGQPPLQAPSSTGRDVRPQSAPSRPPARGGGGNAGVGGRTGWRQRAVKGRRAAAALPGAVGKAYSKSGRWLAACRGMRRQRCSQCCCELPRRGAEAGLQARGAAPQADVAGAGAAAERFSEAPKDGIIANDQIPCVPAAACAAMALPVPQSSPSTSWSDGRGLLHSAAGVAGARRYACWAWRRRCWGVMSLMQALDLAEEAGH